MLDYNGKHDNRTLQTGEIVHLIKHRGSNWGIKSYERSRFEDKHLGPGGVPLGPKELKTAIVFAQEVGWEDLRFGAKEEAYAFVEEQIRAGKG